MMIKKKINDEHRHTQQWSTADHGGPDPAHDGHRCHPLYAAAHGLRTPATRQHDHLHRRGGLHHRCNIHRPRHGRRPGHPAGPGRILPPSARPPHGHHGTGGGHPVRGRPADHDRGEHQLCRRPSEIVQDPGVRARSVRSRMPALSSTTGAFVTQWGPCPSGSWTVTLFVKLEATVTAFGGLPEGPPLVALASSSVLTSPDHVVGRRPDGLGPFSSPTVAPCPPTPRPPAAATWTAWWAGSPGTWPSSCSGGPSPCATTPPPACATCWSTACRGWGAPPPPPPSPFPRRTSCAWRAGPACASRRSWSGTCPSPTPTSGPPPWPSAPSGA